MGAGNIAYGVTNKTNISGVIEISKTYCSGIKFGKRVAKVGIKEMLLSNSTYYL